MSTTVKYELAVHLKGRNTSRALRAHITQSGGLSHPDGPKAVAAARLISTHPEVERVKVSRVECTFLKWVIGGKLKR